MKNFYFYFVLLVMPYAQVWQDTHVMAMQIVSSSARLINEEAE